jgi:hypothetical protein
VSREPGSLSPTQESGQLNPARRLVMRSGGVERDRAYALTAVLHSEQRTSSISGCAGSLEPTVMLRASACLPPGQSKRHRSVLSRARLFAASTSVTPRAPQNRLPQPSGY